MNFLVQVLFRKNNDNNTNNNNSYENQLDDNSINNSNNITNINYVNSTVKTNNNLYIKENLNIKIIKNSKIKTTNINFINAKLHSQKQNIISFTSFAELKNIFSLLENFEIIISDKSNYDIYYKTLEFKSKNQTSINNLKTSEFWINYC